METETWTDAQRLKFLEEAVADLLDGAYYVSYWRSGKAQVNLNPEGSDAFTRLEVFETVHGLRRQKPAEEEPERSGEYVKCRWCGRMLQRVLHGPCPEHQMLDEEGWPTRETAFAPGAAPELDGPKGPDGVKPPDEAPEGWCRACRDDIHHLCLAMAVGATGDECACPCRPPGVKGPAAPLT